MRELKAIVAAARALRERREPFLMATVVAVRGSAYRRPGERMLADSGRWLAGSLSGGCVERLVMTQGFFRTRHSRAALVAFEQAAEARDGSGCEGELDVLIERLDADAPGPCDPLRFAERCWRQE